MFLSTNSKKLGRSISVNSTDTVQPIADPIEKKEKKHINEKYPKKENDKMENDDIKLVRRHSASGDSKKVHHAKQTSSQYSAIKVYSISNCSTRETLRKKIAEGIEKDSVKIDWDKIMSNQP